MRCEPHSPLLCRRGLRGIVLGGRLTPRFGRSKSMLMETVTARSSRVLPPASQPVQRRVAWLPTAPPHPSPLARPGSSRRRHPCANRSSAGIPMYQAGCPGCEFASGRRNERGGNLPKPNQDCRHTIFQLYRPFDCGLVDETSRLGEPRDRLVRT
jgi:hypothetical protein